MRVSRALVATLMAVTVVAAGCSPPTAPPSTPTTDRIDVSSTGDPANDGSGYIDGYLSQSANGRFVLFSSVATNLVAGDTNAGAPMTLEGLDLFVRDRVANSTVRVSMRPDGSEFPNTGGGYSSVSPLAAITRDGRYVIFSTTDPNTYARTVYRHDRATAQTVVFAQMGSTPGIFGHPDVSDDGNVVAFTGLAPVGAVRRSFVLEFGSATPVDVGSAENSNPRLSGDGRYVAADDYRFDRVTASASPVIVAGASGTDVVLAISGNGRFVAVSSSRAGLDPGDTNSVDDLYVSDMSTSSLTLVSTGGGPDGIVPNGGWALNYFGVGAATVNARYALASISDNGDRVAFITDAPDVLAAPTTGWNTYVRTLSTGATQHVTADHQNRVRWQTWGGRFLSSDGSRVVVQGSRSAVVGTWSHPIP